MNTPEPRSPTEALDLQQKNDALVSGEEDPGDLYPYVTPDYEIPFPHIDTEKQLVADNFLLDHFDGVKRVFPAPDRPPDPILQPGDLPWEVHCPCMPIAALHDESEGRFKLWYPVSPRADGDSSWDRGMLLCYAESTDGLHWDRPLRTDCLPFRDHRATNIVLEDAGHHIGLVLNPERSDPDRRFLMVYNPHGRAQALGRQNLSTVAASPDGRRWTVLNEDTPYRHHHFQRIIWDPAIRKWVGYSQYSHHWNPLHCRRQIGRQESEDFIRWSPKEIVLSADWDPNLPPHLEFHEMSVRKEGGLYIGITGEYVADPLWCVRNGRNWRDFARVCAGLYFSRDGKRWRRAGDSAPWVDNRGPGSIDHGFVAKTVAGQLVHDGKMYIPYLAQPMKQHWFASGFMSAPCPVVPAEEFTKGKREWERLEQPARAYAIGVLILREDGWARLEPGHEYGTVLTRQFVFEGDELRVNAQSDYGFVRVELLDPDFRPYLGFSAEECVPVHGPRERIWHPVSWDGGADVRTLWNKPVRIRFHLQEACLYGFRFTN